MLVDLEVLVQLLLELVELLLQCGLLEDLCFLVGVDDSGGDELVNALALVLGQEGVGFRSVGLVSVSVV